jgi:hypothetical protein
MGLRRSQRVASGLQTSSAASLAGGPSLMSSLWVATLPMTVGPLRDHTSRSRAAVAELVWPLQCGSGRAEGSFSRCSRYACERSGASQSDPSWTPAYGRDGKVVAVPRS